MTKEDKILEIRNLINQAMIDGVITEQEVNKIFKKAQEYGVVDECEELLETAQKKIQNYNATLKQKSNVNKIKYGLIILAGLVFIFIIYIYKDAFFGMDNSSSNKKDFKTIEEALANYDFVAARSLLDYDPFNENLQKIIKSEITYYCSNGVYDKALASLNEYTFKQTFYETDQSYSGDSKDQYYYDEEVDRFNNLLDLLVNQLVLAGKKDDAISYLNLYSKGKAKYSNTSNKLNYYVKDFTWRDEKIKSIEKMK